MTMLEKHIESLLRGVAEEQGINNPTIEEQPGNSRGDGYMGIIKFVRITGHNEQNEVKSLNLVVKGASTNEFLRKSAPIITAYHREIYVYNIVFPTFTALQEQQQQEQKQRVKSWTPFKSFPRCYSTSTVDYQETLVLQNLKDLGFTMWNRRVPMNNDHLRFVLAEYGKFHGLSFVLRYKNPRLFKFFAKLEDVFVGTEARSNFLSNFTSRCKNLGKLFDENTDQRVVEVYNKFVDEISEFFDSLLTCGDEHCVIVHGDGWTNNMMFKYDDAANPNKPTEMSFIDFQISKMAPPVLDISYFFYTCCNETDLNNLDDFLKVYHNSLAEHLKVFGVNPDEAFPYTALKDQWKRFAKFGLVIAIFLIHIMLSDENEAADLSEAADSGKQMADAFNYDIANHDEYDRRVKALILHFVENDFL